MTRRKPKSWPRLSGAGGVTEQTNLKLLAGQLQISPLPVQKEREGSQHHHQRLRLEIKAGLVGRTCPYVNAEIMSFLLRGRRDRLGAPSPLALRHTQRLRLP